MKMNSLNLPTREPKAGSFHRNGDCKCGCRHEGVRSYGGYSWCILCEKLRRLRYPMKKRADPFPSEELNERTPSMITTEEKAVAYLRQFLTAEQRQRILETMQSRTREDWYKINHIHFGLRIRNALRLAGFTDQSFGGKSLDDVYYGLLQKAVGDG